MHKAITAIIWTLPVLLASCTAVPTTHRAELDDYGPAPVTHQQIALAYYQRILFDAPSVRAMQLSEPEKIWVGERISGGSSYGYLVCVTFEAKNEAGEYVHVKDALVIRHDTVDLRVPNADWFQKKLC